MLILNALIRGGIPFIIMGGIALLLYYQGKYPDAKSTFLVGLISLFVSAASVIYTIDNWSLPKQSAIHFMIMLITIYPILLLSGWFTITTIFDAFKIFIIFVFVGLLLWVVFYTIAKVFSW